MDTGIERILGIFGDEKRVYRFSEDVSKEDFEYSKIIDTMVFGERGLVQTLGQTWNLVNDARFQKIENLFVVNRRAYFGGDTSIGKQYMSDDGMFHSTTSGDIDTYSELLGEGRFFYNVIVHPDTECPTRKWLERIHTPTSYKAGELTCNCTPILNPNELKDQSDEYLWNLIRSESPNYFSQSGSPNRIAARLFDLFRADLVGLIADYSTTPLIDEWVTLDTGDLVDAQTGEQASVFAEVDILEKALTYRATMRGTAAKILRSIGFQNSLKNLDGSYCFLTNFEKDTLLRMVYQSNWPDDKAMMISNLTMYIAQVNKKPFEQREQEQMARASERSKATVAGLMDGTVQPINQETDGVVEVEQDEFSKTLQSILADDRKRELFMMFTDAERRSEEGKTDVDKLNMKMLVSMLTPVFLGSDYDLTDERFETLIDSAEELGYWNTTMTQVEGDFEGESA